MHKQAWASKGDVYHLIFDLSWFIYGTCWPREDSVLMYLLFALIQHTTGRALTQQHLVCAKRSACRAPSTVIQAAMSDQHASA